MSANLELERLRLRGAAQYEREQHDELNFTDRTRTVLDGELARRVRRRFGVPAGTEVWLEEEAWEGGTDYTRENSTRFIVGCPGREVAFIPDSVGTNWEPGRWRDSVFARFDAWLHAAHSDARLWGDWFDQDSMEQAGRYASIPARPDTAMWVAAERLGREKIGKVYLWGERASASLPASGWKWELHSIAARGYDRPEHGDTFHRRLLSLPLPDATRTAAATNADRQRLLMHVTDLVMPGQSSY